MRRRTFIAGFGAALLPLHALAQQRMRRIAVLTSYREDDAESAAEVRGFPAGLQEQAGIEGENIAVEYRFAAGDSNVVRTAAADIARMGPEVVLTNGTPNDQRDAAGNEHRPHRVRQCDRSGGSGPVVSLARPGGNVTGFTNYEFSIAGSGS